ncbi:MAG: hypothetical protein ACYDHP_03300 [Ferrimicrobium sp.]
MDEWLEYLDAYELHLNQVERALGDGKSWPGDFQYSQPYVTLPRALKGRSEMLVARTDDLSNRLRSRMQLVKTVLDYSRRRNVDKVVLVDVFA